MGFDLFLSFYFTQFKLQFKQFFFDLLQTLFFALTLTLNI